LNNQIEKYITNNIAGRKKMFAVLIDPDSTDEVKLLKTCELCNKTSADMILVGGSLITNGFWDKCITIVKELTKIPVILFPGNILQINSKADAILFLSMISGRNADLLIGKHVLAAPDLKKSGIEVIPTGYMIVDGGNTSSVMYMSNTIPIPHNKSNIAACTAMAGEMLGLRVMYMDAGSGAVNPISMQMIKAVKQVVSTPLFVGGGIRNIKDAHNAWNAGADVIVIGNAIETNPEFIAELANGRNAEALK